MKRYLILSVIAFATILPPITYAQSTEAGIVSTETQLRDRFKHSIMVTYLYGPSGSVGDSADRNMQYYSLILSGEATIFGATTIWASLPVNQQDGLLGSVTGIGDLMVIVNEQLFSISGVAVSLGVGGRFGTASVNQNQLPQSYQSGLGSSDLLLDADVVSKSINVGLGYQLSGSRSANELTQLKRGDEYFVRGGYTYRGSSFDLGAELLAVQQLQKSSALDPRPQTKQFVDIAGSDNLQIGFILKGRYYPIDWLGITGSLGTSFGQRTFNTDGLTRAFTASLGLTVDL